MKNWKVGLVVVAATALAPVACSKSPGAPSISFTSPLASGPANGTVFKYRSQPVTLTITNATRTGSSVPSYSVEVATDSGFANKVFTREGIAEASGATTNVTLSTLAGGATFYWRSRATIENVAGPYSGTQAFVVQPQIIINTPAAESPTSGTEVFEARPTFSVSNATRTGPVGTIFYEFQLSTSSSFSPITASATVQEQQGGHTTWTVSSDLTQGTYFWRARAVDPTNDEQGSYTGATTFSLTPFDMKRAVIHNNPGNLGSWREASKVTLVDTSGPYVIFDFDKREGPGRWPSVAFGSGSIQYTLGMCFNLGGTWHCSAAIQFWEGRELEAGGGVNYVGYDWYYDARWGAMTGHQPQSGEKVGFFAAAGNIRDSNNWAEEMRTNVVIIPWGSKYTGK